MGGPMQHSVAPSGHRVNLAGWLHVAPPGAGRHRASVTSSRRVFIAVSTLLAGLAVAVHVGWLASTHSSSAPRTNAVSVAAQHDSAAPDWIRANLPTGISVLADGFDPPAGYQPVPLATAGANWRNYSYLLTTTTTDPPVGSDLAPVW